MPSRNLSQRSSAMAAEDTNPIHQMQLGVTFSSAEDEGLSKWGALSGSLSSNLNRPDAVVDHLVRLQGGDRPALARRDLVVARRQRQFGFLVHVPAQLGRRADDRELVVEKFSLAHGAMVVVRSGV
jgi:hypothetical protein